MFAGSVIGGRRVYVPPGFCPPNLLLAGAIAYEYESCPVRSLTKHERWICFLVVSLVVEKHSGVMDFAYLFEKTIEDWDLK